MTIGQILLYIEMSNNAASQANAVA